MFYTFWYHLPPYAVPNRPVFRTKRPNRNILRRKTSISCHAIPSDMAMIPPKVKALFEDHKSALKYFALATASKEGVPNVVPIGFLWVANDKEIWVVDNYLNKTYANIKENPVAAVYAIGGEGGHECVQVKGAVRYFDFGDDYEEAVKMAHAKNPAFPAKGLIKIIVTDVYDTTPGENAGKKYKQ